MHYWYCMPEKMWKKNPQHPVQMCDMEKWTPWSTTTHQEYFQFNLRHVTWGYAITTSTVLSNKIYTCFAHTIVFPLCAFLLECFIENKRNVYNTLDFSSLFACTMHNEKLYIKSSVREGAKRRRRKQRSAGQSVWWQADELNPLYQPLGQAFPCVVAATHRSVSRNPLVLITNVSVTNVDLIKCLLG